MKQLTQGRICSAKRSNGTPCKSAAIRGGTVCRVHGGSAPQVRRKAEERLKALVDPAIVALQEILKDKAHPQRLAAAKEVLSRDGRIGQVGQSVPGDGELLLTWERFTALYKARPTEGE